MRYWAGICWSLITKIPEVDFCKLKLATIAFYYYDIATKSVWIAFGLLLTAFKLESKMKNNTHNYLHDQFFDDYSRAYIRFTIKKAKFTHVHSPVRKFPGYYWIRMVLAMIFFKMTNHWFRLPIVDGTLWKWCFFYNGSLKATCITFRICAHSYRNHTKHFTELKHHIYFKTRYQNIVCWFLHFHHRNIHLHMQFQELHDFNSFEFRCRKFVSMPKIRLEVVLELFFFNITEQILVCYFIKPVKPRVVLPGLNQNNAKISMIRV